MNLIQALKLAGKDGAIRRPIAKHLGSDGDGWVDPSLFFTCCCGTISMMGTCFHKPLRLTREDLLAEDWEYLK